MTQQTDTDLAAVAALRERLERAGWTLSSFGGDGYAACRWGRFRELATLADVERFADQVGAATTAQAVVPPPRLPGWADYEAEKRAWMADNPGATADDYERAVRQIATDMGL